MLPPLLLSWLQITEYKLAQSSIGMNIMEVPVSVKARRTEGTKNLLPTPIEVVFISQWNEPVTRCVLIPIDSFLFHETVPLLSYDPISILAASPERQPYKIANLNSES
jgi:hypothetical protein